MVAIKDMEEKPKCCSDCPLVEKQINMLYGLKYFYCKRTGKMVDEKEIDVRCPLVEIEENTTEKLDKIRQIYRQWSEIGDNADCWAFKEIREVLEQE